MKASPSAVDAHYFPATMTQGSAAFSVAKRVFYYERRLILTILLELFKAREEGGFSVPKQQLLSEHTIALVSTGYRVGSCSL
jgi:hypothetical protein